MVFFLIVLIIVACHFVLEHQMNDLKYRIPFVFNLILSHILFLPTAPFDFNLFFFCYLYM